MSRTDPRNNRWWPFVVLTFVLALLQFKELLGQRPYWRDTMQLYVPFKHFMSETLRAGEWPQWWPYDSGGTPLLANPQLSVFHPSTLAYLVAPFWTAFLFQDFLATGMALLGTFLLARSLRLPKLAAVLSAVFYGASGFLVSLSEFQFLKLSAATMPWYLWALLRAMSRGRAWTVAPAAMMALLLLAGDPQTAILASGAGVILAIGCRGGSRRMVAIVSPVAGGILAAVQLLPAMGIVGDSERQSLAADMNGWALRWPDVLDVALPIDVDTFGLIRATFIGFGGLALIFATVTALRRRTVLVLWCIAILGIWLALGDAFGLNWVARHVIPFWAKLRYPVKSAVLAILAFSLLVGEGWQLLSGLRWKNAAYAGVALAVLLVGVSLAEAEKPAVMSLFAFGTILTGLLGIWALRRRHRVLAGALLGGPTAIIGALLLKTTTAEFYDPPALVEALQKAGVSLTGPSFDRFDQGVPTQHERAFADRVAVGGRSLPFGALWHLPTLGFSTPASSWRVMKLFSGEDIPFDTFTRAFGLYGVGYVVMAPDILEHHPLEVIGSEPEYHYAVARLPRSLPRAYAVHRGISVPDFSEFRTRLRAGPLRPGREVYIEGALSRDVEARPDQLAVPSSIVHRDNSHVSIDADMPWPGFVVLNEAAYNGWSVEVDGIAVTSLIANGFVKAVEAPAGRHRIEWTYDAPYFRLGLSISACAWLLLAGAAIVLHRRRLVRVPVPELVS